MGCLNKLLKLGIGDLGGVKPEGTDLDLVLRALIGSGRFLLAAHEELPTGDMDHVRWCWLRSIRLVAGHERRR